MSDDPTIRRVGAVALAAALLLLPGLGGIGLWAPDEPRYAQVAEEIRSFEHGARGLVLMHLNGEAYDQKPPLYFWSAALVGAPFGRVSETAARLPSAIAGIACVGLVGLFGRRLIGARGAVLAALLLLTTQEFAHLSRRVQLDPMLVLFETAALAFYWRIAQRAGANDGVAWRAPASTRDLIALHTCLGLAVLTKGPVGLLVPALVIATDLAWQRNLRALPGLFAPRFLMCSLAPGLAWAIAAVALAPPGYFEHAIVDNLFGRFARGTAHARPWHYFLWNFPLACLPWSLAWPAVWRAARREIFVPNADPERARAWRFLLGWVGVTLVFFSFSTGKRSLYLLTAAPAAAMLTADVLRRATDRGVTLPVAAARGLFALAAAGAIAGVVVAIGGPWFPHPLPRGAGFTIALLLLGAIVAFRHGREAPPTIAARRQIAIAVATVLALELVLFAWIFRALDAEKSPRAIAEAAAARVPTGHSIGLLGERGLIGGVVYYGNRRVAQLDRGEDVARFLAEGGHALIARRRDLSRIAEHVEVEVVATARGGRRALVVAIPRNAAVNAHTPGSDVAR